MPYSSMMDRHPAGGVHYAFAPSGLIHDRKMIQAGELYIDAIQEVTATGFYKYHYAEDELPRVQTEMLINPSGHRYISASGRSEFTVTFMSAPVTDPLVTTPLLVAWWVAVL